MMAWVKRPADHNRIVRWHDSDTGREAVLSTPAAIHYETEPGVFSDVDMAPTRVDNAALDGWRVTSAGYHFALGIPGTGILSGQDGVVGFGGRQGQHWFKYRLQRVGYLHWPTRTWDDIGGAPTYNRAKLTQEIHTATLPGPDGSSEARNIEVAATWANIWTTPGGGSLSVQWRPDGDRLKEEIAINQAGRSWIAANHPPSTPASETWFGFVFRLDWSDIPYRVIDGVTSPVDDDIAGERVELRDAANELLGFMPLDYLIVTDPATGDELARVELQKRLYQDGGNHYLLAGTNVATLAGLPAGDLVFDPTISTSVGADADDGGYRTGAGFSTTQRYLGYRTSPGAFAGDQETFARFTGISGLSGATITTSYTTIHTKGTHTGGAITMKVRAADAAAPAAPTSAAEFTGATLTTAGVDWDTELSGTSTAANQSPSINTVIQELADSYDPSTIVVYVKNDGTTGANYTEMADYNWNPTYVDLLYIEYTAGSSDLAISVSDAATIAEAVTLSLSDMGVSVSEAVGIAEAVTVSIQAATDLTISVSDIITVAETVTSRLTSLVSVSDALAVAEAVTVSVQTAADLLAPASAGITVAESVALTISEMEVSASDVASVAEAVTVSVGVAGAFSISVSDTVTVAEVIDATNSTAEVGAGDSLSVAEAVTVSIVAVGTVTVSVSEAVGVAESVTLAISDLTINATEAVSLTDSPTIATSAPQISVSDSASVGEAVGVAVGAGGDYTISVSDSITASEAVTVALPDALQISPAETITLAELVVLTVYIAGSGGQKVIFRGMHNEHFLGMQI